MYDELLKEQKENAINRFNHFKNLESDSKKEE